MYKPGGRGSPRWPPGGPPPYLLDQIPPWEYPELSIFDRFYKGFYSFPPRNRGCASLWNSQKWAFSTGFIRVFYSFPPPKSELHFAMETQKCKFSIGFIRFFYSFPPEIGSLSSEKWVFHWFYKVLWLRGKVIRKASLDNAFSMISEPILHSGWKKSSEPICFISISAFEFLLSQKWVFHLLSFPFVEFSIWLLAFQNSLPDFGGGSYRNV